MLRKIAEKNVNDPDLKFYPANKAIKLSNSTCVYCRKAFSAECEPTKEHVVGRKFVPTGVLDDHWNLIVRACKPCNNVKSALENDIGAISMQPDIVGRYASDDPRLHESGKRKGEGSISKQTNKPVNKSHESISAVGSLAPGLDWSADFSASPQLDEDRAFELASYHTRAFHYWITFDKTAGSGHLWPGSFAPVCAVHNLDWGNVLLRGFQDLIKDWNYRVSCTGQFFKIVIRRSPDSRPLWAWAVEWNCKFRVVGFYGINGAIQAALESVPPLSNDVIQTGPDSYMTFRIERPMPPEEDILFRPIDEP